MICWEHIGRAVRNDSAPALGLHAEAAEAQRFQRTNQKADSNFGWLEPIIQHPVSRGKGHQPAVGDGEEVCGRDRHAVHPVTFQMMATVKP